MEIEKLDHIHAWTDDVERVAKLFKDVFGLKTKAYDYSNWNLKTAVIKIGDGRYFELVQALSPESEACQTHGEAKQCGIFGLNLKVPDLDKAIAEVTAKGYKQIAPIRTIGGLRQVWFDTEKDFGIKIELSEYKGEDIFVASNIVGPED